MQKVIETDVVILGGGVSGLWLLNRLRQQGFSTILLETATLGGGQTHKSQGIIHGGMKYALQGALTAATQSVSDMPTIWENCLNGTGEINLTHVPILSEHQYLWSPSKVTGALAGFFAGLTLKGTVNALNRQDYPEVFQHPQFKGMVYALAERVIDVPVLVRELAKPHQDAIFKIDPLQEVHVDQEGNLDYLEIHSLSNDPVKIKAQKYVFTAGAGNEKLIRKFPAGKVAMQRRPLHMVIMKTDYDFPVYAHCLGASATPRITITTHKSSDGKNVWYLGGQIAEEGVKFSPERQIELAYKELEHLFPWMNFENAEFGSFLIDRAEAKQPDGKRPDGVFVKEVQNMIVAWPTKLVLAPKVSEDILKLLEKSRLEQKVYDPEALRGYAAPEFAKPIWDELL